MSETTSEAEPRIVNRWTNLPKGSITALLDWCHERALSPDNIHVSGAHLTWQTPETDEERDRREAFQRDRDAKTEAWEWETYHRLRAKYEPIGGGDD